MRDGLNGRAGASSVRVEDEGVGIPAEIIPRVTEPFFTTKETGKGTGLGLSMVAGFAQQSGGRLEIQSTTGKGTRMDLILPATGSPAALKAGQLPDGNSWLSGKRLMLVDDDDSVRIVLAEQLRDLGAIVDDFATGKSAIECARKNPEGYDLVLSDFAMPKLNGLETLRAIEKVAPRARQLLMTGYADDIRLADSADVPLIRKPIDLAKLNAMVVSAGQPAGDPTPA